MITQTGVHEETPVMSVHGMLHDLDVYEDRLVIHHNDFIWRLFASDEVIFFSDIEGLHVYAPSIKVGSRAQLIINLKNGKTQRLSYSSEQHRLPQLIKETVEDLIAEGGEKAI